MAVYWVLVVWVVVAAFVSVVRQVFWGPPDPTSLSAPLHDPSSR